MIDFTRDGTKVKITIDSGIMGYAFKFNHECNTDHFAYLMTKAYQEHMNERLEAIRREAYNQGWKDAKAKTKKATWFKGWWI